MLALACLWWMLTSTVSKSDPCRDGIQLTLIVDFEIIGRGECEEREGEGEGEVLNVVAAGESGKRGSSRATRAVRKRA